MLVPQQQSCFMKCLDKDLFFDIIYEDNHLLIVDKPYNIPTQPDCINNQSMEELVKKYLKEKLNKSGNIFLQPIHRLDKPVSGLLLFAKSSKSLSRLNDQMRNKEILKRYKGKVEGILKIKKATLIDYLIHLSHKALIVPKEDKNAKRAELRYEVIKEYENATLLDIELISGRYHQIRAQLSHLGHPIWGDKKYNSKVESDHIFLNCFSLEFLHPVSKEKLFFKTKFSLE